MSKPEFSKPFNILDAKAGAPYCCRDGRTAQVLKWDRNVSDYPMMGVVGKSDDPRTWTATGSAIYGAHGEEYDCDLVMLPVGMCQSKPVFMGDELVTRFGDKFVVEAKNICVLCEENTWPVPTPAYPVTLMTDGDLVSNYYGGGPVSHEQEYQAWRRIANSALRHAIDAGQVVPSSVHDKATRALIRGGWQDLGGQEWEPKIGEKPAYIRDEERDMVVAQAVKMHFIQNLGGDSSSVARFFAYMDLPSIIASVTGADYVKEGAQ